eukprot:7032675-Pyramimonas_sp.AAC.1
MFDASTLARLPDAADPVGPKIAPRRGVTSCLPRFWAYPAEARIPSSAAFARRSWAAQRAAVGRACA